MISRESIKIGKHKAKKRASWVKTCRDMTKKEKERIVGLHKKTTKRCSCFMCSSSRKNKWTSKRDSLTLQERKILDKIKEDKNLI